VKSLTEKISQLVFSVISLHCYLQCSSIASPVIRGFQISFSFNKIRVHLRSSVSKMFLVGHGSTWIGHALIIDNHAILHPDRAFALLGDLGIMCDDDDSNTLFRIQINKKLHDILPHLGIKGAGRFIR